MIVGPARPKPDVFAFALRQGPEADEIQHILERLAGVGRGVEEPVRVGAVPHDQLIDPVFDRRAAGADHRDQIDPVGQTRLDEGRQRRLVAQGRMKDELGRVGHGPWGRGGSTGRIIVAVGKAFGASQSIVWLAVA